MRSIFVSAAIVLALALGAVPAAYSQAAGKITVNGDQAAQR